MGINDFNKMSKMSELLNCDKNNITGNSPLDDWFRKLCDKQYIQLNYQDVTTMFNQNIGLEFAIYRAFELLSANPICGLYDWQLLELISKNVDMIKITLSKFFDD